MCGSGIAKRTVYICRLWYAFAVYVVIVSLSSVSLQLILYVYMLRYIIAASGVYGCSLERIVAAWSVVPWGV